MSETRERIVVRILMLEGIPDWVPDSCIVETDFDAALPIKNERNQREIRRLADLIAAKVAAAPDKEEGEDG